MDRIQGVRSILCAKLLACSLLTLNPSWTSVKETSCEANHFSDQDISCTEFLFFSVGKNIFNASNLDNLEIGNVRFLIIWQNLAYQNETSTFRKLHTVFYTYTLATLWQHRLCLSWVVSKTAVLQEKDPKYKSANVTLLINFFSAPIHCQKGYNIKILIFWIKGLF